MCDNQNNTGISGISATEGANQLIELSEIKREPHIKEEPSSAGNLTEFPALNSYSDQQSLDVPIDCVTNDIFSNLTIDGIKIEVKDEMNRRNARDTKSKRANENEEHINNQRGQPSSGNEAQSNQHGSVTARNARKSNKMNFRGGERKQHQCEQCYFATKYKCSLKRHSHKHTGKKPFPCKRCEKSFTSNQNLQYHMKIHVNEFLFSCSICLKGFDRKNEKLKHEIDCNIHCYECHLCKKSFGSIKSKLITHMCVHNGEKTFECTECSKRFRQENSLNKHSVTHAGLLSFRCSKCRQGFALENEMIAHDQSCSRRVYECYVCGKSMGLNKENSKRHMRIHTGDKPFECTQCSKKFTEKSKLNDHMKIHSHSLPWKCVICRQGFTKQSQWKAHQRNCTRRMYECHLCKNFFGSFGPNLKRHMVTHSGEKPFECGTCQRRFTRKSSLTKHIKRIHNKIR